MALDPAFAAIDHRERSDLLTSRYQKPLLVGLLRSWLGSLDEVEAALAAMPTALTDVTTAEGVQLQTLARLVGAAKILGNDALQRVFVQTEILARRSSGTVPQLLAILDVLFDDQPALVEYQPATVLVGPVYSVTEDLATTVARVLARARPAAVRLDLLWSSEAEADTFAFASGSVVEADATRGFGDALEDPAITGGVLAGVIES